MKLYVFKKWLSGLLFTACVMPWTMTYAAEKESLLGNVDSYTALLKKFSLIQVMPHHQSIARGMKLAQDISDHKNTTNTLQLAGGYVDSFKETHVRYNQYYRQVPVWGIQVVYTISPRKVTTITGSLIDGIEQDVPDVNNAISTEQAKKIALGRNVPTGQVNPEKVIYFDEGTSNKAVLAYYVSYATQSSGTAAVMSYFIDANDGRILKEWNSLASGNKY